jgi:hypothetical protein
LYFPKKHKDTYEKDFPYDIYAELPETVEKEETSRWFGFFKEDLKVDTIYGFKIVSRTVRYAVSEDHGSKKMKKIKI